MWGHSSGPNGSDSRARNVALEMRNPSIMTCMFWGVELSWGCSLVCMEMFDITSTSGQHGLHLPGRIKIGLHVPLGSVYSGACIRMVFLLDDFVRCSRGPCPSPVSLLYTDFQKGHVIKYYPHCNANVVWKIPKWTRSSWQNHNAIMFNLSVQRSDIVSRSVTFRRTKKLLQSSGVEKNVSVGTEYFFSLRS